MSTRDELVRMAPKGDTNWPKALWRASGLGYCPRQQILVALGIAQPVNKSLSRKYAVRSGIHETVQGWIKQNFGHIAIEKFVLDEEECVGGHIDAIIYDGNTVTVVEIKTCQQFYFKSLVDGKSKPYWGAQVDFYHERVTAEHPDKDVDIVSLLVEVGEAKLEILDVEHTPYRDITSILNVCWESGILPEMADDCRDCAYTHICTEPIVTIDEFKQAVMEDYGDGLILKEEQLGEE